jgi:hypothetical protein
MGMDGMRCTSFLVSSPDSAHDILNRTGSLQTPVVIAIEFGVPLSGPSQSRHEGWW